MYYSRNDDTTRRREGERCLSNAMETQAELLAKLLPSRTHSAVYSIMPQPGTPKDTECTKMLAVVHWYVQS